MEKMVYSSQRGHAAVDRASHASQTSPSINTKPARRATTRHRVAASIELYENQFSEPNSVARDIAQKTPLHELPDNVERNEVFRRPKLVPATLVVPPAEKVADKDSSLTRRGPGAQRTNATTGRVNATGVVGNLAVDEPCDRLTDYFNRWPPQFALRQPEQAPDRDEWTHIGYKKYGRVVATTDTGDRDTIRCNVAVCLRNRDDLHGYVKIRINMSFGPGLLLKDKHRTFCEILLDKDAIALIGCELVPADTRLPVPLANARGIEEYDNGSCARTVLTIDLRADAAQCTNIFANEHFGPFTDDIAHLRTRIQRGGRIMCIVYNNDSLVHDASELWNSFRTERRCPTDVYLMNAKNSNVLRRNMVKSRENMQLDRIHEKKVTFKSAREACTALLVAQQREYAWKELQPDQRNGYQARLLRVPGAADYRCLLVAIEDQGDSPLRLTRGERTNMRIWPLDLISALEDHWLGDDWDGQVLPKMPGFRATEICILASQNFDEDRSDWMGQPASTISDHIVDIRQYQDPASLRRLLDESPRVTVDVRIRVRHDVYRLKSHTICMAYQAILDGHAEIGEILKASRFDRLPIVNVLAELNITAADVHRVSEGSTHASRGSTLDLPQAAVVDGLTACPAGYILVNGPADRGEMVFTRLTTALVASSSSTASPRKGARVFWITRTNDDADRLALELHRTCSTARADAVVVRVQTKNAVKNICKEPAMSVAKPRCPLPVDPGQARVEREDAHGISRLIFEAIRSHTDPHFRPDVRVSPVGKEKSIAHWILLACGARLYMPEMGTATDLTTQASVDRVRAAVESHGNGELIANFCDSLSVLQECAEDDFFSDVVETTRLMLGYIGELAEIIYNLADAVVSTPAQAMSPEVWQKFKPRVFVLNDAGRADAFESLVHVLYPTAKLKAFVGDTLQPRPAMRSKPIWNEFALQGEVSELARFSAAGMRTFVL